MNKFVFSFLVLATWASTAFTAEVKILAFSGSARKGSFNQQLVEEAASYARKMGAQVTVISLKDYPMPFYDADLETNEGMPKSVKKFRDLLVAHDAFLIATPEYNSAIPALLKNAIDWASRSEQGGPSRQAFQGKVVGIMSASPGGMGGARALDSLRAILEEIGATVIPDQVSIPSAHSYFADSKRPENDQLKMEVEQLIKTAQTPLAK